MKPDNRRQAAKKFKEFWLLAKDSEAGGYSKFWLSLLSDVLGVDDVFSRIDFQSLVRHDEVVRVNRNAIPVIMNICDRQLQEKRMAKSWAIVCAANRYSDDPTQEASAFLEATPIVQRFVHVTYKPERNEWLNWARSTNDLGVQNIEPEICDFIEAMPEHIWYRLIDNGGYDEALKAYNECIRYEGKIEDDLELVTNFNYKAAFCCVELGEDQKAVQYLNKTINMLNEHGRLPKDLEAIYQKCSFEKDRIMRHSDVEDKEFKQTKFLPAKYAIIALIIIFILYIVLKMNGH